MKPRKALARGGLAAAACVACCAPPLIAALGVTMGLATAAGVFVGLAAAIAVLLVGGAWIAARVRRSSTRSSACTPASSSVPVAPPVRRESS